MPVDRLGRIRGLFNQSARNATPHTGRGTSARPLRTAAEARSLRPYSGDRCDRDVGGDDPRTIFALPH